MHSSIQRVALLSVHTCPLALLGGKKTGGMNVYVRELARALDAWGVTVDVFTRSQDDCQPRIVHAIGQRGRVIHIPAGPEMPLPVAQIANYVDEFTEGVLAFAAAEGLSYDLLHGHYWLSGLVAERLCIEWQDERSRRMPFVQMFHTLGEMKNRIAQNESERAPQSRLEGEQHVVQVADALVAATPAEYEQLVTLYNALPKKIATIPPGVNLARFQPLPQAEARKQIGMSYGAHNVLFVGRIEPLKGIDTLLDAVARLRQSRPELTATTCLTIVGGDPWADTLDEEMARLQQLCDALGLDDLVTFAGAKDQAVLPRYYAAADVVVMPSHYESFGMVALEAMAMGTPVIASEVGGLAHLVQDGVTGFHVPAGDGNVLSRRLERLLSDPALRQSMGQKARAHAEGYDWCEISHRLLQLYGKLVTQKNGESALETPC